MIKLIASDMDGTLLDVDSEVPPETFELIGELGKRGVHFATSSGRRYSTLRTMFEPVADQIGYVASIGCQVAIGDRLLDREVFSGIALERMRDTCDMFGRLHMAIYDDERAYLLDDLSCYDCEMDKDLLVAERIHDLPSPDVSIIKVSICCEEASEAMDMTYVLERELSEWCMFSPSGSNWIDVSPRQVSKATGLARLMRHYGVSRDEVVAFGDSMNDYAMLRLVGHPYVMGNARPAVKQLGEKVVGTNAEHAVQAEMRRLLEELG